MNEPRPASLQQHGWEIEDAERIQAAAPDRFRIPPPQVRCALPAGAHAELVFVMQVRDRYCVFEEAEYLWVEVLERNGDWYRGRLETETTYVPSLKPGMDIWFQHRHVVDVAGPTSVHG